MTLHLRNSHGINDIFISQGIYHYHRYIELNGNYDIEWNVNESTLHYSNLHSNQGGNTNRRILRCDANPVWLINWSVCCSECSNNFRRRRNLCLPPAHAFKSPILPRDFRRFVSPPGAIKNQTQQIAVHEHAAPFSYHN